jgi:transmembrane sensor
LESGEAVFRVAKDPARPFVVSAAQASVRAVGTVFSVARNGDSVVVTVSEGRVAVVPSFESARGNPSGSIALQANERISISPAGTASEVRRVAANHVPAWDDNQLVFENARVADVVSRFNRRNRMQIHISDQTLRTRTVSGIFDADDPRSFVDFLTVVAGASSTESGSDEIIVTPHSSGPDSIVPRR